VAWLAIIRVKLWPARHGEAGEEFDPRKIADAANAVRLGASLSHKGEARGALAAYERGIELDPKGDLGVQARLGAARELVGALHQPTMAYQHLVVAMESGPTDAQVAEAREIMAVLQTQVNSVPRAAGAAAAFSAP